MPDDVVRVGFEIEDGGHLRGFDELTGKQVVELLMAQARPACHGTDPAGNPHSQLLQHRGVDPVLEIADELIEGGHPGGDGTQQRSKDCSGAGLRRFADDQAGLSSEKILVRHARSRGVGGYSLKRAELTKLLNLATHNLNSPRFHSLSVGMLRLNLTRTGTLSLT